MRRLVCLTAAKRDLVHILRYVARESGSVETARRFTAALRLPVVTKITAPKLDHGFGVNLIGRGYPAPSRSFRWCTGRMKFQLTSDHNHGAGEPDRRGGDPARRSTRGERGVDNVPHRRVQGVAGQAA